MILIGPSLKSGIGQHANKYTKLFTPHAAYYQIGTTLPEEKDGLIFVLPIAQHLKYVEYAKTRIKNLSCMTVCETETVHEDYQMIMDAFKTILVPSAFCKRVLSKQFPDNIFRIVHAHIPTPRPRPYTFYFIGNVADQRKNFKNILEAFVRLNEPNTRLLVKATCNKDIDIQFPRVEVINGLISDDKMDEIHWRGDCYVSFSSSEGVGMGAVEAAMRDKPVIITNYGGAPEYIKTPYTIDCDLQELSQDDFLFKKGMKWGNPNFDQLLEFMKHVYENDIRMMDHSFTRELISKESILQEFALHVSSDEYNETGEDSTGSK
jgi:glycosyltransferase involved in cell wall biosynthesis|tara:strand:- start:1446 stop:2405 length:960 start_codon:yes stop_codon:yes gene_type:complete